jgi:hypothetical protein
VGRNVDRLYTRVKEWMCGCVNGFILANLIIHTGFKVWWVNWWMHIQVDYIWIYLHIDCRWMWVGVWLDALWLGGLLCEMSVEWMCGCKDVCRTVSVSGCLVVRWKFLWVCGRMYRWIVTQKLAFQTYVTLKVSIHSWVGVSGSHSNCYIPRLPSRILGRAIKHLMTDAVITSETSVNFHQTTRRRRQPS